jgi:DNA processing protein
MITNLPYFIALNRIATVGPRTVAKLIKRWPNLAEMFALPINALIEAGLPSNLANAIESFDLALIDEDLKWSNQDHQHILCWESPFYPKLLKEIHDPPVVIYAKGDITALNNPMLAIVGTRKPSITGSENAKYFAKSLAMESITIVSGLALGIDAQAHLGCLEAKGKTIAVMGTGLDCIYPYRHRDLAARITENGLLMSEFSLKSPPIAGHFPRRNRIISGLSLATLIIEAAIRSGSLITARFALEQNRDVLAIPGSIHNPQARGCHHLLQQGAKLVTSIADVLDTLQIQNKDNIKSLSTKADQGLMQWIGFEMTTVDQLMLRSQRKIEDLIGELSNLELQGLVQTVPGGYIRC